MTDSAAQSSNVPPASPEPASLQIVDYPHPVLRQKAKPVGTIDDHARAVAQKMVELMLEAPGIGLAAPQVALPWRLFVVHVPLDLEGPPGGDGSTAQSPAIHTDQPLVCFNPKLSGQSKDLVPFQEGCLSLPHIQGDVRRPSRITITAQDINGSAFTLHTDDLLARCIQHEFDHLEGVLIIDKFGRLDRMKSRGAVKDLEARG